MVKIWLAAAALVVAALFLAGCCGIPFGGGSHATITGLTGRDGTTISNGGTTDQRVQHIIGKADNPGGAAATSFKGRIAIMLNNVKQYVTATSRNEDGTWNFEGDFVISRGTNTVVVQVEDEAGGVYGSSETFTVNGDLPPRQVEVVLTWDTDDSDVDMHIWSPEEEHTYYSSLGAIPGCNLDLDDTDGYGPETFICETNSIEPGEWAVKVRYYNTHGIEGPTTATVRVRLNEGQPQTFTHTFTADQANRDDDTNDWTVIEFNMP